MGTVPAGLRITGSAGSDDRTLTSAPVFGHLNANREPTGRPNLLVSESVCGSPQDGHLTLEYRFGIDEPLAGEGMTPSYTEAPDARQRLSADSGSFDRLMKTSIETRGSCFVLDN